MSEDKKRMKARAALAKNVAALSLSFPVSGVESDVALVEALEACINKEHDCGADMKAYTRAFKSTVKVLKEKSKQTEEEREADVSNGVFAPQALVKAALASAAVAAEAAAETAVAADKIQAMGFVDNAQQEKSEIMKSLERPQGGIKEGLEYLGCEHICCLGRRCKITEDDIELMTNCIKGVMVDTGDTEKDVSTCPRCNTEVKEGDFAWMHVFYKSVHSQGSKPEKIRSVPRVWCYTCANTNAKERKMMRLAAKKVTTVSKRWEEAKQKLSDRSKSVSVEKGHVDMS